MDSVEITWKFDSVSGEWYESLDSVLAKINVQCDEIMKIKDEIIEEMEGWDVKTDT